jgi:hypothetical protein
MAKKKKKSLGLVNEARRKAESFQLHTLLVQRNSSGANGSHANRREKRARTRNASERQALRDFDS